MGEFSMQNARRARSMRQWIYAAYKSASMLLYTSLHCHTCSVAGWNKTPQRSESIPRGMHGYMPTAADSCPRRTYARTAISSQWIVTRRPRHISGDSLPPRPKCGQFSAPFHQSPTNALPRPHTHMQDIKDKPLMSSHHLMVYNTEKNSE